MADNGLLPETGNFGDFVAVDSLLVTSEQVLPEPGAEQEAEQEDEQEDEEEDEVDSPPPPTTAEILVKVAELKHYIQSRDKHPKAVWSSLQKVEDFCIDEALKTKTQKKISDFFHKK